MQRFFEEFPLNSGRLAQAPAVSNYVEDVALDANVLVRIAIPAGARFFLANFDGPVRIRPGISSTVFTWPLATTNNGAGSELNPSARRIPETLADNVTVPTQLCLIAAAACSGSIAFYS